MHIPPAAANPKDKTKEMLTPVTRYHKPPIITPTISEIEKAKAFEKMFPGKNLKVKYI